MSNDLKNKYNEIKKEMGIYGSSQEIEEIIEIINTVAPTDLSVLIVGVCQRSGELPPL